MYDKYPVYDVPQNNIIQRFFSQRWSAIVIEIAMTIVITVAAGRAFEFFDPFDGAAASFISAPVAETAIVEETSAAKGVPLDLIVERAIDFIDKRRFDEAGAMFDLAIAAYPEDASNYLWRGYVDMQAGDYSGAQDVYRKLLILEPMSFEAHNSLCWAQGELGEFTSALSHCGEALEYASSQAEYSIALENRCWVQVEIGDYDAATRDCQGVFELFPVCKHEACALAHYNLGRVALAQGQVRAAAVRFNHAIAIGSTYPEMYLEISAVYDKLGIKSASLASFERFLSLVGETAEASGRLEATGVADS